MEVAKEELAKNSESDNTENSAKAKKSFSKKKANSETDGEWLRYEKWFSEQYERERLLKFFESQENFGNVEIEKLLSSEGVNFSAEINLLDLVKLRNADFLFFAKKKNETAEVHIKKYNRPKLESRVRILFCE